MLNCSNQFFKLMRTRLTVVFLCLVAAAPFALAHNIITKTTSTPTVAPGGVATYTIRNDAAGTSSPVNLIQVRDTLPAGFTYQSTTSITLLNTNATRTAVLDPAVGDASPVWGTFSNVLAGGAVAAGAFQIVFNAAVAPTTACGTYANTVTKIVNDVVNDHTNSNATNVANVIVAGAAPSLVVSKVANAPLTLLPNGLASYTLRVTNTAAAASCPATGVTLTDALPAGFTYAATGAVVLNGGSIRPTPTSPAVGATAPAWGGFTIPAGGSVDLTFTATVGAATAPGTYSNSANVTTTAAGATITPFNGATSTADDVIVRSNTATVTLAKTWINATVSDAISFSGTGLTALASVANTANETDTGAAQTVPLGTVITFGETFTAGVPSSYTSSLSCTGTSGLAGNGLTVGINDTAIVCTYTNTKKTASLRIRKSTNGAGSTGVSGAATFSFTTNNGGTFSPVATTSANTFVSAGTSTLANVNTATVITETVPAGGNWVMTGAICIDANAAFTGNPVNTNLATFNAVAGTVSLPATSIKTDANITCDITNTRRTLEVTKVVVKASTDLTDYRFDLLQNGVVQAANVGSGGTTSPLPIASGAITFGEDSLAPNNSLSIFNIFWQCTNGDGTIVASSGGVVTSAATLAIAFSGLTMPTNGTAASLAVTCTITNTRAALLTFIKSATPADGTSFAISSTFAGGPGQTANPTLAAGFGLTGIAPTNQISIDVLNNGTVDQRGTYTVTETLTAAQIAAGWDPTFIKITCQSNIVGANGITSSSTPPYSLAIPVTGSSRTVCTILNRKLGTVTVKKTLVPAADPGKFNLSVGAATVATAVGDSGSGAVSVVDGVPITIAETAVAPALLTNYTSSLSCVDAATSAVVGIASNVGTSGSITPAPGQNILCTFTNTKNAPTTATVTLAKTWSGATLNDAVSVTATGLTTLASVANTANETDTGALQTVAVGSVLTLGESFTTGVPANYSSSLSCSNTTGLVGNTLTIAPIDTGAAIVCTYTNTLAPKKIDVAKAAGVVIQVSALSFQVPYTIVVKNTDAATQATNVQISDNLSTTFAAGSPVITISTPAQTSSPCTINSSGYNGTTNPYLLSGANTLAAGTSCTITFTALVTYPNAGAIPATPQNNSATAGVYPSAPGSGGVPTGAPLASDNSSNGSTPAAGDTPGATPVSFVPQRIDSAKAVGAVVQVSALAFDVPYSIVVKNTGTVPATNVQVSDNLVSTFASPAVVTISAPAAISAGSCTINGSTYNGTSNPHLLTGTNSLAAGASCTISFTARVTYPNASAIPATPQNNTATAGVYASAPGAGGVPTGAPLASDNSSNGSTPAAGDTPSTTPVSFVPQKIDTVKAVGVPKQLAPKIFEVSYSIVVANVCKSAPLTCASTPPVFNVQVNDNLSNTFPTASSITISNYAVSNGANGAVCTPASVPYQGNAAASALLSGTNDLTGGQTCIITFKATVDFGTAAVPTAAQSNLAYASGVGSDSTVNPGYTYSTTGAPIAPAVGTTVDTSTSAPATSGAPGTLPATPLPPAVAGGDSDSGLATAVVFAIQDDGELVVRKSTVTKIASSGDVIEYSILVSNSSSSAVKTKVTDVPPLGFEYVAGSAKIGGVSNSDPISSNGELIFDIGTVAAKSSIELRYRMKLGDAVEGGEASNCVVARGINTLTGTDKESGRTCATVVVKTGLFLEKRVNVTNAELGDSVEYSLKVKSVGGTTRNVTIADNLPLGFKLIEGTVKLVRAGVISVMANPAGSPGPALTYNVGTVANKEVVEIRYRVRLGIGADLGDGINRAQAKAPFATSSLVATAKILVTRGVFTREACIAGKVFVDCNQNSLQDKGEIGIPGVRLYMEDGTNITTDENGQYSICGVRAISHVMQVDTTTMPVGSRMGITSNRNLGDGVSLMLNIKAGELYRADFIEGSCTPSILEQVNQRIKSGVVNVPLSQTQTTPPKPIEFDSSQQGYSVPALCTTQNNSSDCEKAGSAK